MRVAILRCNALPSFVTWHIPNENELFADDAHLVAAFTERGIEASAVRWGEPDTDWNRYDLALIRSTWDYIDERERFLAALSEIEASSCRLFNPLDAVRWNSEKSYLFDLNRWGVPIVPTLRATTRDSARVDAAVATEGWRSVVMKPIVGAGGASVSRVAAAGVGSTLDALEAQYPARAFLVQPLIESVMSEGEWSFIFIAGELSHVLLKKPASGDFRAHGIYGGTIEPAEPRSDDRREVEAMLRALPFDLLYARLDLVRVDGRLAIMELELIEPMLYFNLARGSAERLADAAIARLEAPR